LSSLIIACISAVIASGLFVYGVHLYLSKNKPIELDFIDFIFDERGEEYALLVDSYNPDRVVAMSMDSLNEILACKNKGKTDDAEEV